jgi:hypothetical protein
MAAVLLIEDESDISHLATCELEQSGRSGPSLSDRPSFARGASGAGHG